MRNNSKLLVVILVVMLAASYFVVQNNQSSLSDTTQLLIPELQDKINDVDGITISKNEKTISLSKTSGTWHLAEANNYLADTNKIATLLLDLRKFKLTDKKTNNPENYKNLSLADSGENAATEVELRHDGKQFANISLGKEAQMSQGTYVRNNSEKQTWLASGKLNVSLESKDWIVTTILDVAQSSIQSVNFSADDAPTFGINKLTPNDKSFALIDGLPEKMQLKSSANLNELANGLQKFIIDSVADVDVSHATPILKVSYQTFSGVFYHLNVFKIEEKYVLSLNLENANSDSNFDNQLQNWHYYIPSYKFDALNKKLVDLIEPKIVTETKKS